VAHVLIAGTTGYGKTQWVRRAMPHFKRGVLVFDPNGEPGWPSEHVYADPERFGQAVREARHAIIIVDEATELVKRYDETYLWLATRARHLGHLCLFLSQRPSMLSPTVRGQCIHTIAFRLSFSDAKLLADERACEGLLLACTLTRGEYVYADPDGVVTRGDLKL